MCCLVLIIATPDWLVFYSILLRGFNELKTQQADQCLEHRDLSTFHHSSRTCTGYLSIGESYTRLLHYVILHYLVLVLNTCLTLLMFTSLLDPCTLSQILVFWAHSQTKLYVQRSFAYHGPTQGILCHSHSDINRNLIASSELWKLMCFLSINELNTNVVFCYFHLPTINTTLVINNLTHLSYYWH